MIFSERIGETPPRLVIQTDSIDDGLRNKLWNAFSESLFEDAFTSSGLMGHTIATVELEKKLKIIWHNLLKQPVDLIPQKEPDVRRKIRSLFFDGPWYFVYDIIEFCLGICKVRDEDLIPVYNRILAEEMSAYRIVGNMFVKITEESEIECVESISNLSSTYEPVKQHIQSAIRLISNRTNPDFRNSIKESISAVEAACRIVTQSESDTLGVTLKKLEEKYGLHGALKNGFSSLYGYSSDADGIRHAMMDIPSLEYNDALFFLVICSSFSNYVISKIGK